MPKYAAFNSAISGPTFSGWYDTDLFTYASLPPPADMLELTTAEWDAHFANPNGWAVQSGALVTYTPPAPVVPVVVPTAAQLAQTAIAAGVQITSTSTPALNGTYACDDAAQARINRVYALIQRGGGAVFPAGLTSLPWPDESGALHTFTGVAEFLAFETAVGNYVLALDMIQAANSGTLPSSTVNIE